MYMYLFLYTSMRSKRCFKNPQQNHFLCLCRCQISVILYTKSIFLEKIKLYNFDVMRSNFVSNFVCFNSLGILMEWKDYRFGKIFPKLIFLSILTKATLKSYDFCHWVCLESALVLNDLFFDFFCQYCKNEHFGSTFAKSSMQRDFYKKKDYYCRICKWYGISLNTEND